MVFNFSSWQANDSTTFRIWKADVSLRAALVFTHNVTAAAADTACATAAVSASYASAAKKKVPHTSVSLNSKND
jgi:hypothetical protein